MTRALLLAAMLAAGAACTSAAAMALTDLEQVDTAKLEAGGWAARKAPGRLTLACTGCDGFTAVDILLEPASDGTEQRIRAGTTTATTMLDICRRNAETTGSECFDLEKADLKGAVGFVSDVGLGPMGFASTYVLWQDGYRLTIRNVAPTREEAARVGKLMFGAIASQIVQ